jgi:uncharacterized RDD family membrane protein YckC
MEESVSDSAIRERLAQYSLSELEDVLAHVDRDVYPDRERLVTQEIEARLASVQVDALMANAGMEIIPPSFLRRVGASLVDFSIQVLIPYIILYFIVKVIYTPLSENKLMQYLFPPDAPQSGGGRGGGRGGRGSNDIWSDLVATWESFYGFVTGVISGQPEAMSTLMVVGEYFLVYLLFRMFWTCWRLSKSGATSGMKEVGIELGRADGEGLTLLKVLTRFILQHILFITTLGISGLWMLWDKEKCALHDRLLGTRLIRVSRSW